MLTRIIISTFSLLLLAGILMAEPAVRWLYLSTGHILDNWQSSSGSIKWHEKSKFKKSLNSISAGGRVSFSPRYAVTLTVPFFFNTQAPYTSPKDVYLENETEPLGTYELESPTLYTMGVGDLKLTQSYKFNNLYTSLTLGVPTGYHTNDSVRVNYGAWQNGGTTYYDAPWTGFGVYKIGPGFVFANPKHYIWFNPSFILYSPASNGLVQEGDFTLPMGYTHTYKLSRKFKLKGHLSGAYKSFHWSNGQQHRIDTELTPGTGISFTPSWNHEFSLNIHGTYWSTSTLKNEADPDYQDVETPKKLSVGLYYGHYL